MHLDDFLQAYPSKHQLIKDNLLNSTLNFHHRLKMFLKHIVLSNGSSLTLSHYNYRIEFQLRGAPHAHGTLWMDWKRFTGLPRSTVCDIETALNRIKAEEPLNDAQNHALSQFADLFISVSLKDPATSDIVKEVNVHHHTKKACQKYGSTCRFNFPRYPIHKTIISAPSKMVYPDEKERVKKMMRHSQLLDGVKEVLTDEKKLHAVCMHNKEIIDEILQERKLKWKLKEIIDECKTQKVNKVVVPSDIQDLLQEFVDEEGKVSIKVLERKEALLQNHEERMNDLRRFLLR